MGTERQPQDVIVTDQQGASLAVPHGVLTPEQSGQVATDFKAKAKAQWAWLDEAPAHEDDQDPQSGDDGQVPIPV